MCAVTKTVLPKYWYCVVQDPVDKTGRCQLGKEELRVGVTAFFLHPGRLNNQGWTKLKNVPGIWSTIFIKNMNFHTCQVLGPGQCSARFFIYMKVALYREGCTGGAVVRGFDWQSQDREFKPHWRYRIRVVLLSKAFNPNHSVVRQSKGYLIFNELFRLSSHVAFDKIYIKCIFL